MKLKVLAGMLAAWLVCNAPAWAAPAAEPDQAQVEQMNADMTAFGRWLGELTLIELQVQRELEGLGPAWGRFMTGNRSPGTAANDFRPVMAHMLATLDATDARLAAMEVPDFPSLDLAEDIRPRRVRDDTLRLNRDIRAVVRAFAPLVEAIAGGDMRVIEQVVGRLMGSVQLLLELQVVISRASLAATPRDDPSWHAVHFQLLYLQSAARLFKAVRPFEPRVVDRTLADDLLVLGGRLETTARDGLRKNQEEVRLMTDELASAEASGDTGSSMLLRRGIAVFNIDRELFELAGQLAALLQAEAPPLRGRPLTQQNFDRIFSRFREIRTRMEDILQREHSALAGNG